MGSSPEPAATTVDAVDAVRDGRDMTNATNEAIVRAFLGGMGPTIEGFKKTYTEMLTEDG